jgi:hypothetical protein
MITVEKVCLRHEPLGVLAANVTTTAIVVKGSDGSALDALTRAVVTYKLHLRPFRDNSSITRLA